MIPKTRVRPITAFNISYLYSSESDFAVSLRNPGSGRQAPPGNNNLRATSVTAFFRAGKCG